MNRERLQEIYRNTHLADKVDIDSIRQLTVDYPYFNLPYVILSKYYHDTQHYKFEDMLRQAAMRVKDRQALYEYIHGKKEEEGHLPVEKEIELIETQKEAAIIENEDLSVGAFLSDEPEIAQAVESEPIETFIEPKAAEMPIEAISETLAESNVAGTVETHQSTIEDLLVDIPLNDVEELEKPVEFILDTHHENINVDSLEFDHDIIGEEIATEFTFSKDFNKEEFLVSEVHPELALEEEKIVERTEVLDNLHFEEKPSDINLENENYFKDAKEPQVIEDKTQGPEMDFFAWLRTAKTSTEVSEPVAIDNIESAPEPAVIEPEVSEEEDKDIGSNFDLIDRFIKTNPQITRPKKEFFNPENMAKKSEVIDLEFVSETLANIFYEQGNYELAIKAYEKLSLQNPSKQSYFADLIEKIRKERK